MVIIDIHREKELMKTIESLEVQNEGCETQIEQMIDSPQREAEMIEVPEIEIDMDEFDKGVDEVTGLMGKIAGLINVGVEASDALEYFLALKQLENERLLNEENIKHSLEVVKINAEHGIMAVNERVL